MLLTDLRDRPGEALREDSYFPTDLDRDGAVSLSFSEILCDLEDLRVEESYFPTDLDRVGGASFFFPVVLFADFKDRPTGEVFLPLEEVESYFPTDLDRTGSATLFCSPPLLFFMDFRDLPEGEEVLPREADSYFPTDLDRAGAVALLSFPLVFFKDLWDRLEGDEVLPREEDSYFPTDLDRAGGASLTFFVFLLVAPPVVSMSETLFSVEFDGVVDFHCLLAILFTFAKAGGKSNILFSSEESSAESRVVSLCFLLVEGDFDGEGIDFDLTIFPVRRHDFVGEGSFLKASRSCQGLLSLFVFNLCLLDEGVEGPESC